MTTPLTIECSIDFCRRGPNGRRELQKNASPSEPAVPAGRIPRIARLMALALRFEHLLPTGRIKDYAALARLGQVTPARISQITNLLHLAPDIQERILFLPPVRRGRDPIHLAQLQPITQEWQWSQQRRLWAALLARSEEFWKNRAQLP